MLEKEKEVCCCSIKVSSEKPRTNYNQLTDYTSPSVGCCIVFVQSLTCAIASSKEKESKGSEFTALHIYCQHCPNFQRQREIDWTFHISEVTEVEMNSFLFIMKALRWGANKEKLWFLFYYPSLKRVESKRE